MNHRSVTPPAAHRRAALASVAALAAVLAVALAVPAPAGARGDAVRGQLLYQNHCQGCHTSSAHVRANRKARTRADIGGFVRRWQQVQGLGWSAGDVEDVSAWLYLRFYDPDRPAPPAGRAGAAG